MIARCQIRTSLRGSFTPIHIREKREKTLFPLFSNKKKKIESIGELHEYITTLETTDPCREILTQFPEYLFKDEFVGEYMELYMLSKELGSPPFPGSIKDYPCTFIDFMHLFMLEKSLQGAEK